MVLSIPMLLTVETALAKEKATLIFAAEMTEIATENKGGYPELATALKKQRQTLVPTFFLFGGGSLGPSTLSSLDRGTHIIDLLNSLEPHAMGIAKREFSFLEDELSLRSYEAAFPLVCSNVIDTLTQVNLDGLVESVVVRQGPYKLGVLSVLDKSTIEDYALSRIRITDQKLAIIKQSKKLRKQGVDLIVLMYSNYNQQIFELLSSNIIDLSLRRDEHYDSTNQLGIKIHPREVLLSKTSQIAIIHLSWKKGDSKSLLINWQPKSLSQYQKDPKVLRQVINYTDRLANLLKQKIGVLTTAMDTNLVEVRTRENSFANFITDALKNHTRAEIALLNGGTIRGEKKYPANYALTRKDISKELPFRNKAVLLKVTGRQVWSALENGFSLIEIVKGRFPQISGMKVKYNSKNPIGDRVISVEINGLPLIDNKFYTLATTDYLASGGDGYTMFKNTEQIKYASQMSRLVSDIVIDTIKMQKRISVGLDSRLEDLAFRKDVDSND